MIRSIHMRLYLLQRRGLFYPQLLCNNFSNQHQRVFSRTSTHLSTTRSFFTWSLESPSLMHVLSHATWILIISQSEFWLWFLDFSLSHFLMFLLPSLTSNRSSDQEKGYSTLAKSFVEKVQKLESDFQR